jgi:hypothetical protein
MRKSNKRKGKIKIIDTQNIWGKKKRWKEEIIKATYRISITIWQAFKTLRNWRLYRMCKLLKTNNKRINKEVGMNTKVRNMIEDRIRIIDKIMSNHIEEK